MNRTRFTSRFGLVGLVTIVLCLLLVRLSNNKHKTNPTKTIDDPIERALNDLPVCQSDDRQRQRSLLVLLNAWSRLAREHHLNYWLSFGTLVGYVQHQRLSPYSVDLAVTIMAHDTPQLIQLAKRNFSSEFQLKIQPDWYRAGYIDRAYHPSQQVFFLAPNAQFVNRNEQFHLDIYPSYDYDPRISKNLTRTRRSSNLTEYDPDYDWISYPRQWTYPLQSCLFSGLQVSCPFDARKLVKLMFGPAALNTPDMNCVNGTWIESKTI
jgi:phosphorylcholine metabolism protein LicD